MKRLLKDFDNFTTFQQSTAIAYSLWERAFETQLDKQTAEWIPQLIEYQLEATETLEAGKVRDNLLKVITGFKARSLCGRPIAPIEVVTRIEKVFVENGKLREPTNHHLVRVGLSRPMHTKLVNRQFGLIRTLNPVIYNEEAVSMSSEPW